MTSPTMSKEYLVHGIKYVGKMIQVNKGLCLTIFLMAILLSCNAAPPKNHLIFSEGSSLVRENVLNLAKVFSNI